MDPNHAIVDFGELFRVVAETASDAIISIDQNSVILFANPASERMFGYAVPEILGQQITLLVPDYLRHRHQAAIENRANTRQKHVSWSGLQLTGLHKNGTEIPLEISFGEHARDGIRIYTGILRDISERHRIEAELRNSREKYAKMIQSSPDAITLRSLPDRRYIEVSQGFERLTGYSADEVIGKTPAEIGLWAHHTPHVEILDKIQNEGQVREVEFSFRTKSGELRNATVSALRLVVGKESYMLSVSRDITERKKTEERLAQLAAIVESSQDAIIGAHLDGTIISWNHGAEAVFGYRAEEVIGKPSTILAAPDQQREVLELLARIGRREQVSHHETTRVRKDGRTIIVSVTLSPIHDANGNVVGASTISRDITEHRRFEARFASLVQDAPYGIYQVNLGGRFLQVNPALVRMLGYDSESELLVRNMQTDVQVTGEFWKQFIHDHRGEKEFLDVETEWKRKTGERIVVRLSGRPVSLPDGSISHFEVFAEDVTEKRSLERQLLQSQKMDAIGRLAGGIAHDFNNLLGVILGQNELLQGEISRRSSFFKRTDAIEQSARRAAELTKQLLAFSRRQFVEPRVVDVNGIVREIEKLLKRLIGEDVNLMMRLQPNAGNVKIDPSQFEQVLMNLVVNARDAMPNGGKLILETMPVELDDAYARQHLGAMAGEYVLLAVSDTGIGMDSQTMGRMFEPFFTTKTEGRGTGLGLSTVYGIVKQNGGYIMAYSEVGHGTTFRLYFPRVKDPAEGRNEKPTEAGFPRGGETILLVEDEVSLRSLTRELLEENGYKVIEAEHSEGAIELLKHSETRIDLLLTDVVMPGMGGRNLARHLAEIQPGLKILYMSGHTDEVINNREALPDTSSLIGKPFTRATLLNKVREALDASRH